LSRIVINGFGVHGLDKTQLINNFRGVREQLAYPRTCLAYC
jgi:hypothetical protein